MMTIKRKQMFNIKAGLDLCGDGCYLEIPLDDENADREDIMIDVASFIYNKINDETFMNKIINNEHGVKIMLWADLVDEVVE